MIERILACLAPRAGERIVEIGPGGGVLTAGLVASGARVDAVEIDRDLIARLRERFRHAANFHLHAADALDFDYAALLAPGERCRIAGNLPYNISTPLLFRLLELHGRVTEMLFMLQKEVVDRLAAEPGTAAYGRLGVMLQAAAVVTPLFEVDPDSFSPPPRVDSGVVRIVPRDPGLSAADFQALSSIVQLAFSQRRKMLRHTLGRALPAATLAHAGVSLRARAEELTVEQYLALARKADHAPD